ncbi:MAG: endonuclease [Pseudomonadota bacterium]
MRLATFNVEWFDALFDAQDRLLADDAPSKRLGVSRRAQAEAIASVLRGLDPDAILILEAPNQGARSGRSTVAALEHFAERYALRQRTALVGFGSPTHQEIALMLDPERISARHDPMGERCAAEEALADPLEPFDPERWGRPFPGAPRFDGAAAWRAAPEAAPEKIRFSRPPLEAALVWRPSGRAFRLIGFHLKSLRPRAEQDPQSVRRRHLGQCVWLRGRIDEHLTVGDAVIALGDLNQRTAVEAEEPATFGRRGRTTLIEPPAIPLGPRERRLWCGPSERGVRRPTVHWREPDGRPAAARVDEILISSELWPLNPRWRVWNADAEAPTDLRDALDAASDHSPITLDLEI